jgi:voltage-gated sodium channel
MAVQEAKTNRIRGGWLTSLVESAAFQNFIISLILLNAVMLGIATYNPPSWAANALKIADQIIIGIFVLELTLKMAVWRLRFFHSGWNWFDLAVVIVALLPSGGAFTVLRALRVLRLYRLISMAPAIRKVVEGLMRAIPGMGAIMMILALVFYVSSVMASRLFSETHPQFFGDLSTSAFTLFQVMTLDSWSTGVARLVMDEHPMAWIFFGSFVVVASFAVLNLFIAVIVDALQSNHAPEEDAREKAAHDERAALLSEMRAMREEVSMLRQALNPDKPSS